MADKKAEDNLNYKDNKILKKVESLAGVLNRRVTMGDTIVPSDLGLDFINKLKPVSFKWNDGVAGRTHYGLVAQDIEELLPDFDKTAMDFAALCKDTFTEDGDGNTVDPYDVYSLRYMEFVAPLVKAIQELTAKVAALEAA